MNCNIVQGLRRHIRSSTMIRINSEKSMTKYTTSENKANFKYIKDACRTVNNAIIFHGKLISQKPSFNLLKAIYVAFA